MLFFYQTGEQIQKGDLVRYYDEPGDVEFVADPAEDPADWYVEAHGGGVMVREPKHFGSVFIGDPADDEDLEFVARSS